ncbi:DUF5777 family beta-barrel protein [Aquimarina gracilis]|uniref:DUF5777 family beta-barrel protein n=1 Tax=Aquimarina gracilis TaxID=874422 RepID=A0ABU5ZX69_9FLAO|nr:DUF5777 family beta-barrel protein [Aquimarina gracilis]MEB3346480.1 DUF5777 family beta-barrel protein [Aquimarina gracilis]
MKNLFIVIVIFIISRPNVLAQEDLFDILEEESPQTKNFVTSTFKGTRILNGHSIENRNKGTLEFVISHRFGRVNLGAEELYGLDQSNIRFAFEYGLTDNLMLGIGRSSFDKEYDGFFKLKLLKQGAEKGSFPFAISLFGSAVYRSIDDFEPGNEPSSSERMSYTTQLLIARKFSPGFSLQVTPSLIHRNSVKIEDDPHNIFAVGIGSRVKLTKRVSINGEYHYTVNPLESIDATNSLAFGIDIETGGHVFQIILSNSITMIEKSFITESTDDFFEGDVHLGFNISRAFQFGKNKKKKLKEVKESNQ